MDVGKELIRSWVRTWYPTEYILIIDAVIKYSVLAADDLAYLTCSQTKITRKLCNKLRERRLLQLHTQQEIRQGSNRASSREYYYVNMHKAIDNIKWELKMMSIKMAERFGEAQKGKSDYFCTRCKAEYTDLEVMDSVNSDWEFICKRCGTVLSSYHNEPKKSASSDKLAKHNKQMEPYEELMKRIDTEGIDENDWDQAYANRRPVEREATNPGVRTQVVNPNTGPATVHGQQFERENIEIEVHDAAALEQAEARQREQDRNAAVLNQLPAWHVKSTVSGEQTALGRKEELARQQREEYYGAASAPKEAEEEKPAASSLEDNEQLKAYQAEVRAAQLKAELEEDDDDEEDEDEEDDDDDIEFEELELAPANKRVRFDESESATPASDMSTPNGQGKANGTGEAAASNDAASKTETAEEDSDEDEGFEDVL